MSVGFLEFWDFIALYTFLFEFKYLFQQINRAETEMYEKWKIELKEKRLIAMFN